MNDAINEVTETEVTETEVTKPVEAITFDLPEALESAEKLNVEDVNFKISTYFKKGFKTETEIKFYLNGTLILKHVRFTDIPLTHRNKESMKAFKEYIHRQAKNDFAVISSDETKLNLFYDQLSEKLFVKEDKAKRKINNDTDALKDFSFVQDFLK